MFVGFLFFFVFYSFYVGSPGGHLLGKTRLHCFTSCRLNYCLLGIWTSFDVIISNEVSGKEKSSENLTLNIFTSNLHVTVTCSCCPYLYFGSAIMLVTYFVNFR